MHRNAIIRSGGFGGETAQAAAQAARSNWKRWCRLAGLPEMEIEGMVAAARAPSWNEWNIDNAWCAEQRLSIWKCSAFAERSVCGQEVKAEVTRSKKAMHFQNGRRTASAAQVTTWCEQKMMTSKVTSDVWWQTEL